MRDVTDADLEIERRTILAEVGLPSLYASTDPFSVRYGLRGMGLVAVSHTRLLDWTADEVRQVAHEWFHAGNALLVSTIALPDDLRLPLPPGTPAVREPHHPGVLAGPSWLRAGGDGVLLSGTMTSASSDTARNLAMSVVQDVLRDQLRTTLGHVYSVDGGGFSLDADHDVVVLSLDPGPRSVCDVVVGSCDVLERLSTSGPTDDELERTRTSVLEELELAAGRALWLDSYASRAVRGIRTASLEDEVAALRSATAADLRTPVAELLASLLVVLPTDHQPTATALERLGRAGAHELDLYAWGRTDHGGGRWFRGRYFSRARGLAFGIHDDRLVLTSATERLTVPLDEIVLVGTDEDGDVELVTSRGTVFMVTPAQFRGLRKAFAAVLDRLPDSVLRYDKQRVKVRPDDAVPATVTA